MNPNFVSTVSNLCVECENLNDFYEQLYRQLVFIKSDIKQLGFCVLIKQSDADHFNDYYSKNPIDGLDQECSAQKLNRQLGEYVIKKGESQFLDKAKVLEININNDLAKNQKLPIMWLGSPIKDKKKYVGVIAIYSFEPNHNLDISDIALLDFAAGQLSQLMFRINQNHQIQSQTTLIDSIYTNSTELIWSNTASGELIWANQNYTEAIGISPLIAIDSSQQFRENQDTKISNINWEYYFKQAAEGKAVNFDAYQIIQKPNQFIQWWQIRLNPILLPDGRISQIYALAHDISLEKKQHSQRLLSEQKYQNIFESFQDIYICTDKHGIITTISPSVLELCGYEPKELIGKNITAYYLYNIRRRDGIKELWRKGKVKNFLVAIITQDGKVVDFICNIKTIHNQKGEIVGTESVARDITELKRASEQAIEAKKIAENSLAAKERFLANMSHEIRTPMNGIIGMIDLLSNTALDAHQRDYIQTIKKSSETLLNILNDILDISKIEAGKMALRKNVFEIRKTVDKLIDLFRHQAQKKGLYLRYETDSLLPEYILADETRILQVLSNLSANAIKFSDKGGITVRMLVDTISDSKCMIRCEVADTGIGILPDQINQLFAYFSQIDSSSTKNYAGTGLGLAISKQLCQLMGGDIGVDSVWGQGSVFWFSFQAKVSQFKASQVAQQTINLQHFRFDGNPHILIVDDNLINLKVASEILKYTGCRIDLAHSGIEAIEKTKQNHYEVILMDIQMPQMDGIETTRIIHGLNLAFSPPIIAMTAYSMQEDRDRLIMLGLNDYLSKPITAHSLIDKVQQWIYSHNTKHIETNYVVSQTSAAFNVPIVNKQALSHLEKHIGAQMLSDSLKEFLAEADMQIKECKKAHTRDKYEVIASILHTLKGNAGTLGASQLANYTGFVESMVKNNDLSNLSVSFVLLEKYLVDFEQQIQQIISV